MNDDQATNGKTPPALRFLEFFAQSYRDGDLTREELHGTLLGLIPVLRSLSRAAPRWPWRGTIAAAAVAVESWAELVAPENHQENSS